MQPTTPHDEGLRWLFALSVPLFAAGVGWFVKHLMGRKAEVVQLGLAEAQTEEIRAKIRREDESAEFARMRELADAAWTTAERLRSERDAADNRVGQLLIERQDLKDELKHVTGQLRAAEKQLGLKVRREE